jgi:hypothetical protein
MQQLGRIKKLLCGMLLMSLAALPGLAQMPAPGGEERGPSTPEERAKVVKLTRQLERDPLGKGAKEARQWLTVWLIHVPDIVVRPCGTLLGPVVGPSSDDFSAELMAQMNFSQAAFIIENPEQAEDLPALFTASVEGALKAYEAILKRRPAARRPYLDDLLAKRNRGEISAYVRQAMAGCR